MEKVCCVRAHVVVVHARRNVMCGVRVHIPFDFSVAPCVDVSAFARIGGMAVD